MRKSIKFSGILIFLAAALFVMPAAQAQVQTAAVSGEIERISINNIADPWSGGEMVIGGQIVIIPRNLLMDLPANRLTLTQLFQQAPAACVAAGETGLAKLDTCNPSGAGAFATIDANKNDNGNVISGDVFIEKGREAVTGNVTYISYTDGYYRLNGKLNDPTTGIMVRLNDPTGRHTVQQGLGCIPGTPNCSPDPRFTLDPDNYINVFSTGYPYCIPSTVPRPFPGLPAAIGIPAIPAGTAQAAADGTGDVMCPTSNRLINGGIPVDDSRRFAPIMIGDSITAEGNFETINGVRFLSAHTTMVGSALTTKNQPDQPDYFFLAEVFIDAPGFQNQRARALFIGFSTIASGPDVLLWSLHRDPVTNEAHEFPLGTVKGCDSAAGVGTCSAQGLVGQGGKIWKIRYDVDFIVGAPKPRWNPCAHLAADPRMGTGICSQSGIDGTNIAEMFAILSPIPHEIMTRSGHKFANPNLTSVDIAGNEATNGEYLFPFGIGLGGVSLPEMVEIDLNALWMPHSFSGIPWNLDRRLSPGGCINTTGDSAVDCETTPQPLDPFPFEGADMNPRFLAPNTPQGTYNQPAFTNSALTSVSNRMLSYVTEVSPGVFNFDGDNTILAWPPAIPGAIPIRVTPPIGGIFKLVPFANQTVDTINFTVLAPSGAIAATNVSSIGLAQNASGTVLLSVMSAAPGSYAVNVTALSNTSGVTMTVIGESAKIVGVNTIATYLLNVTRTGIVNSAVITTTTTVTGVNPSIAMLLPNETMQFTATDPGVNWSSSNSAVGSIDATGLFTAAAPGNTTITATNGTTTVGTALVTVGAIRSTSQPLAAGWNLVILPVQPDPAFNASRLLQLVMAQNPGVAGERVVRWNATAQLFETYDPFAGLIDFAINPGEAYFVKVSANAANISIVGSGAAQPSVLSTIDVTPTNATLVIGGNQTFTATALDQFGIPIPAITWTWISSDTTVGTVDNAGVFTANAAGNAIVIAINGSVVGSAIVNVTSPLPVPDIIAPVINSVTLDNPNPIEGSPILVTVNATDNVAVTSVTADGTLLTSQGGNIWNGTITAAAGTHNVTVTANDAAGNNATDVSASYTATPVPEIIAPVINSVALDNLNPINGSSILVTVNATDNVAVTAVAANGFPLTSVGGDFWNGSITALQGINPVNVSAGDAAGNIAWDNTTTYTGQ